MAATATSLSYHIVLDSPWEVLHAEHSGAGAVRCLAGHIYIICTSTSTLGHAQPENHHRVRTVQMHCCRCGPGQPGITLGFSN